MITQSNIIKDELRRIFSAEKIYKVPIYSLVVFTEPKLELYSSSGGSAIHNKKLGKELKKPCYKAEIDISMGKILSAIEKYKNYHSAYLLYSFLKRLNSPRHTRVFPRLKGLSSFNF